MNGTANEAKSSGKRCTVVEKRQLDVKVAREEEERKTAL